VQSKEKRANNTANNQFPHPKEFIAVFKKYNTSAIKIIASVN
jgi:hypothetical protein